MKRFDYSIAILLLGLTLTGCTEEEEQLQQDPLQTEEAVVLPVAFAVSKADNPITRMSEAVVQQVGQAYRGINMRHIIPFAVAGKIGVNDMPKFFKTYSESEKPVDNRAYYYYDKCELTAGVCSFLCYGRAPLASTDKAVNGSLIETFPLNLAPKNIRFSLESISGPTAHPTATALADYMTAIATVDGWKTTSNSTLGVIYLNFLNKTEAGDGGGEPLPGSATNIKAFTQNLETTLNGLTLTGEDDALRTAIIEKIALYNDAWDGFPAFIGLPDGAAVIRWTGTQFEPQINTTTLADINGIDRFAYPAELYYYGNSRIRTSTIDKRKEKYTDRDWAYILEDYEYDEGVVSPNTTAIAIKEPLQYGVAHAQIKLKKTDNTNLTDAAGANVPVGSANFLLKGIIFGGQMPVGFDFKPTTSYPVYSEADMKLIYDYQLPTLYLSSTADATQVTNTLVLQSYDNKKVPVVLEFVNNSGTDFRGLDGIVYNGTKFYLVGEVDPSTYSSDPRTAIRDRVFTQDYTTTLDMKVTGLAKAYNVMPNLLSPRLEMGIELVTKWVATTPEEVLL